MSNLLEKIQNKLKIQEENQKQILKSKDIEKPLKTKIEIKVTQEEKEIIQGLARLQHMNVSEFMRYLALNKYCDEILK